MSLLAEHPQQKESQRKSWPCGSPWAHCPSLNQSQWLWPCLGSMPSPVNPPKLAKWRRIKWFIQGKQSTITKRGNVFQTEKNKRGSLFLVTGQMLMIAFKFLFNVLKTYCLLTVTQYLLCNYIWDIYIDLLKRSFYQILTYSKMSV